VDVVLLRCGALRCAPRRHAVHPVDPVLSPLTDSWWGRAREGVFFLLLAESSGGTTLCAMATMFTRVLRAVRKPLAFCAVLLAVPLVLAALWGTDGIGGSAYIAFHTAEALDGGNALPYPTVDGQPRLGSPLWILFLWAMSGLGLPLPLMALVAGALGWGLACAAVFAVSRDTQMRAGGTVVAVLLALSPLSVAPTTLATEIPWLLCLTWWAVWCTVKGYWRFQTLLVVLLLSVHVNPATLVLVSLLLLARIRTGSRLPWADRLLVSGVLAVWIALLMLDLVADPLDMGHVAGWFAGLGDLLGESDFYWFGVPSVVAGLAVMLRKRYWRYVTPLLGLALLLSGPRATGVLAYSVVMWLGGVGVEATARWLADRAVLRLSLEATVLIVALLAVLPLTVAQTMSLAQSRPVHPNTHQALEAQAAGWVRATGAPDDSVMGSARLGYLAQRSTLLYEGRARDAGELSRLMMALRAGPPDICVSYRSLAWDDLQRTGWFRNTYYVAAEFSSDYDPLSPIKVWLRRSEAFDLGPYEPLSVRLPDGAVWVGHRYEPNRVTPGETVTVTLFVHEPPIAAGAASSAPSGQGSVYLRSPAEGGRFGQSVGPGDRELVIDDPEMGLVWAESHLVETPHDLPMGAYYLSASLVDQGSGDLAHLYQDEITFPINRVTLGYVVVPWRGSLAGAIPVGATLRAGSAAEYPFTLLGYEASGEFAPGGAVDVTLYWEAEGDMGGATETYFVFVHLLDADGLLVAQHDGPAVGGRYPPAAWIPGEPVPDSHTLFLDPALPAGTYTLQAGVYTWPTFERLPAWDAEGEALADRVIMLGALEIR
jgi:hypothetical protein